MVHTSATSNGTAEAATKSSAVPRYHAPPAGAGGNGSAARAAHQHANDYQNGHDDGAAMEIASRPQVSESTRAAFGPAAVRYDSGVAALAGVRLAARADPQPRGGARSRLPPHPPAVGQAATSRRSGRRRSRGSGIPPPTPTAEHNDAAGRSSFSIGSLGVLICPAICCRSSA